MSYIGSKPADAVLETDDITDGVITTSKLADNSVTTAKTSYQDAPFRNIIINGDMSIAQRGTSFSASSSAIYTLDRFKYINVDSPDNVYTITQDTDVPSGQGFAKSLKVDVATADASLGGSDGTQIEHRVEAQNLQYLNFGNSSAKSLTLSFWVKSNKTGTYVVRLLQPDASSRMVTYAYTISSASTWEKKTITVTGDTSGTINNDNGNGLNITWWLSAGTDYQSGSLASTWQSYSNGDSAVGQVNLADSTSNEWYITGVQLEAGDTASQFEFLPYESVLNRCLRYFYFDDCDLQLVTGRVSDAFRVGYKQYPVPMRASPTFTVLTSNGELGNTSVSDTSQYAIRLQQSGSDGSVPRVLTYNFSSEL